MHQQNRTCHYAVVQIHQTKTYYDRKRALFQMCQAYHINLRHRLRNHTCAWFAWLLAEADVDLLWLLVGCVRPGGEKQAGQQASQTGCCKTWKTGDWVTPIRVGNILQMSWTTLSKNALLTQAPRMQVHSPTNEIPACEQKTPPKRMLLTDALHPLDCCRRMLKEPARSAKYEQNVFA